MAKYLYGARINGIQSYIFQTGKLKEIIGGSEQVEAICHDLFTESLGDSFKPEQCLLAAAGKVLYIFTDKEACEKHVYGFFKKVSEFAPGVRFSQAVLKFEGDFKGDLVNEIEERLDVQEHKQNASGSFSSMLTKRAPRTGGSVVKALKISGEEEYYDEVQLSKLTIQSSSTGNNSTERLFRKILADDFETYYPYFSTDIQDLLENKVSGWIAVVHADGNSLGKKIQDCLSTLAADTERAGNIQKFFNEFSTSLELATAQAVKQAIDSVVKPAFELELTGKHPSLFPIRPVLLGGDDLTLIIRGSLAFDFTQAYLKAFETQTQIHLGGIASHHGLEKVLKNGLTACAGIAYIKFNFPFHYGVDLADSLCRYTKRVAKKINSESPPSSLAFYKVQSSFIEDFDEIIHQELTAGSVDHPIRFNYGPYFIDKQDNYATTNTLKRWSEKLSQNESPNTTLREWLSMLNINDENAQNLMRRIQSLYPSYLDTLHLKDPFP